MALVLPTSRIFYEGNALSAMYEGDHKVWEPELPDGTWGPGERMLDPAVVPTTTYVGDYTTGVKFKVVADGRITHFCNRNYDTTGTAMFRFYEDIPGMDAGTLLTTLPVPVFYGQQDVPLPTPIEVFAGHTYMLAFYSGPTTHYPYQDGVPVSLSPNLIDMRGTYQGGNTYPFYDGGQYYWLDVLYEQRLGWDSDTQRFLDATGLNERYAPALDGLVRGLKEHGLWSKMVAVYPFIGGTEQLHKWNLIDPRDTDDAYRLSFVYATTNKHSDELGWLPNDEGWVNNGGYANTHLTPRGVLDQDSTHLAFYSLASRNWADRCDMGCYNWAGPGSRFHIIAYYMAGEFYYGMSEDGITNCPGNGNSEGLFIATRTAVNAQAGYRNGILSGSSTAPSIWLPDRPIYLGAINDFVNRSDLPFGFASIGTGLNDSDAANLNTVVEAYERAVRSLPWTPASIPGLMSWYDPSQLALLDGEEVLRLPDLSGAGQDLVSDPVLQYGAPPRFAAAALNGRGVLRYDRTNVLATPLAADYRQFFVVAKYDAATFVDYDGLLSGQSQHLLIGEGSQATWYLLPVDSHYHMNGIDYPGLNLLPAPVQQWAVMSIATDSGWGAIGPLRLGLDRTYSTDIGYNRHWRGDIAEVIAYDRRLSDAERVQVEDYLRQKWGTP